MAAPEKSFLRVVIQLAPWGSGPVFDHIRYYLAMIRPNQSISATRNKLAIQ